MQGPQSQAVGWPWSGIFNERVNLLRGDYSGASSVTKWRIQVWDKRENSGFEGAVGWQRGSPEVKLCDAVFEPIWPDLLPGSSAKRKRKVGKKGGCLKNLWLTGPRLFHGRPQKKLDATNIPMCFCFITYKWSPFRSESVIIPVISTQL